MVMTRPRVDGFFVFPPVAWKTRHIIQLKMVESLKSSQPLAVFFKDTI